LGLWTCIRGAPGPDRRRGTGPDQNARRYHKLAARRSTPRADRADRSVGGETGEAGSIFAFPFHARVVPRGSRLRLVVRSPNNIYWEKNYGSGGAVADESGKDARTAHLVLYHDAAHPSALDLPLAR
jgi:predicted acyl esterase